MGMGARMTEQGAGPRAMIQQGTGTRSHDAPVPRRDRPWRLFAQPIRVATPRDSVSLRNEAGFTLIELLVVIIVLGLLVGLVGPRLFGRVGQSKQAAARAQIELLGAGLDGYRLDVGKYPDGARGWTRSSATPTCPTGTGPTSRRKCPRTRGAIRTGIAAAPGSTANTTCGRRAATAHRAAKVRTPM